MARRLVQQLPAALSGGNPATLPCLQAPVVPRTHRRTSLELIHPSMTSSCLTGARRHIGGWVEEVLRISASQMAYPTSHINHRRRREAAPPPGTPATLLPGGADELPNKIYGLDLFGNRQ
jgi:hypothetical protein